MEKTLNYNDLTKFGKSKNSKDVNLSDFKQFRELDEFDKVVYDGKILKQRG